MISIDGKTPDDLRAFDAWAQACALNELAVEVKRLSDERVRANDRLRNAQIAALDADDVIAAKAAVLSARKALERATIQMAGRKSQASILQTLFRGTPT